MFFTRIAKAVAWMIFVPSAMMLIAAIYVATSLEGEAYQAAVDGYFNGRGTGLVIDKYIRYLLVAVALGAVGEIATSLRKLTKRDAG